MHCFQSNPAALAGFAATKSPALAINRPMALLGRRVMHWRFDDALAVYARPASRRWAARSKSKTATPSNSFRRDPNNMDSSLSIRTLRTKDLGGLAAEVHPLALFARYAPLQTASRSQSEWRKPKPFCYGPPCSKEQCVGYIILDEGRISGPQWYWKLEQRLRVRPDSKAKEQAQR